MINKTLYTIGFIFSIIFCGDLTYKELPILQSGRIKPIDTFARNGLLQFYGKSSIKANNDESNLSAVDWLFTSFVNPDQEFKRNIFKIYVSLDRHFHQRIFTFSSSSCRGKV